MYKLILRHAWLNLWDKHMTTGRINQVTLFPHEHAPVIIMKHYYALTRTCRLVNMLWIIEFLQSCGGASKNARSPNSTPWTTIYMQIHSVTRKQSYRSHKIGGGTTPTINYSLCHCAENSTRYVSEWYEVSNSCSTKTTAIELHFALLIKSELAQPWGIRANCASQLMMPHHRFRAI